MADDWQPIATEPKDGQCVLVAGPRQPAGLGWWRDVGLYRGKNEAGHQYRDKYGADMHPTHWMPLPEPPANEA